MAMINDSRLSYYSDKQIEFLNELYSCANQISKTCNKNELCFKDTFFEIILNQEDPLSFLLKWKAENGRTMMAPFWADISEKKWCFQNGNPHSYPGLVEMVGQLLSHMKKGETLSPKAFK